MDEDYCFDAELWRWEAQDVAAWYFVTVPSETSEDLRMAAGPPNGFGSVRVEVQVGGSVWRTSVFPQKESGCFVLPMKKAVRVAEDLEEGTTAVVSLRLV